MSAEKQNNLIEEAVLALINRCGEAMVTRSLQNVILRRTSRLDDIKTALNRNINVRLQTNEMERTQRISVVVAFLIGMSCSKGGPDTVAPNDDVVEIIDDTTAPTLPSLAQTLEPVLRTVDPDVPPVDDSVAVAGDSVVATADSIATTVDDVNVREPSVFTKRSDGMLRRKGAARMAKHRSIQRIVASINKACLLYTSDAADE